MKMIIATGIVDTTQPIIINPFDETGALRPVAHIADDVINQTNE